MYMRTRYADLSGELNDILKEIRKITSWRVLLIHFAASCQNLLSHFNYSEMCEKYKKKRIYLIIVLIYNLDGGDKWDINTYEYITNDKWCFFTLEEAFSDNF